jgi:hypothetical protein
MENSISSNLTGLAFAEEESIKVLPGVAGADAVWYGLEPNTYQDFGATVSTVARTPITNTRQQAKGTTTDVDAKGGFNADLTQRNMTRLLQGFFFADAFEKPSTIGFNSAKVVITSVDVAGGNHYNAAAGLNVFLVGHLVKAKDFGTSGNNGIKYVSAIAAGILTTTTAGEAAEAAPPAASSLEAVGYQFPAGDLALTIVGNKVILTSLAKNPTTLGLHVGEFIYVGGDAAGEHFATGARFFGRISAITATQIIMDCIIGGVPLADAGAAKTIRIFFGKCLMNSVDADDILLRSYNLERTLGNDDDGVQSEYLVGAVPNELGLNLTQNSKMSIDLSFVAMDVENRTGAEAVKVGTRVAAPAEEAFNTSSDIVASRISVIDPATANPSALFGYATEIKVGIKNNVSANKALGVVGGFNANYGNFDVDGSIQAYFQSVEAAQAIRDNADVALTIAVAKNNAGAVIDLPLLTLGNGAKKVEKDKPIMVDLSHAAAMCPAGYTASWTVFEYLPDAAMPA